MPPLESSPLPPGTSPPGTEAIPAGRPGRGAIVAGHLGRLLLGGIFLFSGVAKGLTPHEFAQQVAGYHILGPGLTAFAAPALIVLETALGVALVCGVRPVLSACASILLLLMFVGIEVQGILTGRVDACGCFGAYAKRTPGQVIGEDLAFVALACLAVWGLRRWRGVRTAPAAAILIAALLLSTLYVVSSPALPFFGMPFMNRLKPGATLADLALDQRMPELIRGRFLVALVDVNARDAAPLTATLNSFAALATAPTILGLTPATEQEIDAYRWTAIPAFDVKRLDPDVIPGLYRRLPRFFLLIDGRVGKVYDGAPPGASDLLSSKGS